MAEQGSVTDLIRQRSASFAPLEGGRLLAPLAPGPRCSSGLKTRGSLQSHSPARAVLSLYPLPRDLRRSKPCCAGRTTLLDAGCGGRQCPPPPR